MDDSLFIDVDNGVLDTFRNDQVSKRSDLQQSHH